MQARDVGVPARALGLSTADVTDPPLEQFNVARSQVSYGVMLRLAGFGPTTTETTVRVQKLRVQFQMPAAAAESSAAPTAAISGATGSSNSGRTVAPLIQVEATVTVSTPVLIIPVAGVLELPLYNAAAGIDGQYRLALPPTIYIAADTPEQQPALQVALGHKSSAAAGAAAVGVPATSPSSSATRVEVISSSEEHYSGATPPPSPAPHALVIDSLATLPADGVHAVVYSLRLTERELLWGDREQGWASRYGSGRDWWSPGTTHVFSGVHHMPVDGGAGSALAHALALAEGRGRFVPIERAALAPLVAASENMRVRFDAHAASQASSSSGASAASTVPASAIRGTARLDAAELGARAADMRCDDAAGAAELSADSMMVLPWATLLLDVPWPDSLDGGYAIPVHTGDVVQLTVEEETTPDIEQPHSSLKLPHAASVSDAAAADAAGQPTVDKAETDAQAEESAAAEADPLVDSSWRAISHHFAAPGQPSVALQLPQLLQEAADAQSFLVTGLHEVTGSFKLWAAAAARKKAEAQAAADAHAEKAQSSSAAASASGAAEATAAVVPSETAAAPAAAPAVAAAAAAMATDSLPQLQTAAAADTSAADKAGASAAHAPLAGAVAAPAGGTPAKAREITLSSSAKDILEELVPMATKGAGIIKRLDVRGRMQTLASMTRAALVLEAERQADRCVALTAAAAADNRGSPVGTAAGTVAGAAATKSCTTSAGAASHGAAAPNNVALATLRQAEASSAPLWRLSSDVACSELSSGTAITMSCTALGIDAAHSADLVAAAAQYGVSRNALPRAPLSVLGWTRMSRSHLFGLDPSTCASTISTKASCVESSDSTHMALVPHASNTGSGSAGLAAAAASPSTEAVNALVAADWSGRAAPLPTWSLDAALAFSARQVIVTAAPKLLVTVLPASSSVASALGLPDLQAYNGAASAVVARSWWNRRLARYAVQRPVPPPPPASTATAPSLRTTSYLAMMRQDSSSGFGSGSGSSSAKGVSSLGLPTMRLRDTGTSSSLFHAGTMHTSAESTYLAAAHAERSLAPTSADHGARLLLDTATATSRNAASEAPSLVLGTAGFSSGVHYWEVRLNQFDPQRAPLFVGVAERRSIPAVTAAATTEAAAVATGAVSALADKAKAAASALPSSSSSAPVASDTAGASKAAARAAAIKAAEDMLWGSPDATADGSKKQDAAAVTGGASKDGDAAPEPAVVVPIRLRYPLNHEQRLCAEHTLSGAGLQWDDGDAASAASDSDDSEASWEDSPSDSDDDDDDGESDALPAMNLQAAVTLSCGQSGDSRRGPGAIAFAGISQADSAAASHVWGFQGWRAATGGGVERTFGEMVAGGDVLGIRLDCDSGTLSFFVDGLKFGEHVMSDLGVAVADLDCSGSGRFAGGGTPSEIPGLDSLSAAKASTSQGTGVTSGAYECVGCLDAGVNKESPVQPLSAATTSELRSVGSTTGAAGNDSGAAAGGAGSSTSADGSGNSKHIRVLCRSAEGDPHGVGHGQRDGSVLSSAAVAHKAWKAASKLIADTGSASGDAVPGARRVLFPCIGLRRPGDGVTLVHKWLSAPGPGTDLAALAALRATETAAVALGAVPGSGEWASAEQAGAASANAASNQMPSVDLPMRRLQDVVTTRVALQGWARSSALWGRSPDAASSFDSLRADPSAAGAGAGSSSGVMSTDDSSSASAAPAASDAAAAGTALVTFSERNRYRRVRARGGIWVDVDTHPTACEAACQPARAFAAGAGRSPTSAAAVGASAALQHLPLFAGDVVRVSKSAGRDLSVPETMQVLGAYRGVLWFHAAQGDAGDAAPSSAEGSEAPSAVLAATDTITDSAAPAWYWLPSELPQLTLVSRAPRPGRAGATSATGAEPQAGMSTPPRWRAAEPMKISEQAPAAAAAADAKLQRRAALLRACASLPQLSPTAQLAAFAAFAAAAGVGTAAARALGVELDDALTAVSGASTDAGDSAAYAAEAGAGGADAAPGSMDVAGAVAAAEHLLSPSQRFALRLSLRRLLSTDKWLSSRMEQALHGKCASGLSAGALLRGVQAWIEGRDRARQMRAADAAASGSSMVSPLAATTLATADLPLEQWLDMRPGSAFAAAVTARASLLLALNETVAPLLPSISLQPSDEPGAAFPGLATGSAVLLGSAVLQQSGGGTAMQGLHMLPWSLIPSASGGNGLAASIAGSGCAIGPALPGLFAPSTGNWGQSMQLAAQLADLAAAVAAAATAARRGAGAGAAAEADAFALAPAGADAVSLVQVASPCPLMAGCFMQSSDASDGASPFGVLLPAGDRWTASAAGLSLGALVRQHRQLIQPSVKAAVWEAVLGATSSFTPPSLDDYEDPRALGIVRVTRGIGAAPASLAALPSTSARLARSVLGQFAAAVGWGPGNGSGSVGTVFPSVPVQGDPYRGPIATSFSDANLRRAFVDSRSSGQRRAFKVGFAGEGVEDYGGPYRALFESAAEDLGAVVATAAGGNGGAVAAQPLLPLLASASAIDSQLAAALRSAAGVATADAAFASLSPGAAGSSSFSSRSLLPNPSAALAFAGAGRLRDVLAFAGRMLGTALRHGIRLPLPLAAALWSMWAHEAPRLHGAGAIGRPGAARGRGRGVRLFAAQEAQASGWAWLTAGADDEEGIDHASSGLLPAAVAALHSSAAAAAAAAGTPAAGSSSRFELSRAAINVALSAAVAMHRAVASPAALALRHGISAVLPAELLLCFTGAQWRRLFCGDDDVPAAALSASAVYDASSGLSASSQHMRWLWEVLAEASPDDRRDFLRFVTARSRLPSGPLSIRITAPRSAGSAAEQDALLVTAMTCHSELKIPRYSSKQRLRERLLFCLRNAPTLDADYVLRGADAAQGFA